MRIRRGDLGPEAVDREVRGREREQQSDPHAAHRRGASCEPGANISAKVLAKFDFRTTCRLISILKLRALVPVRRP